MQIKVAVIPQQVTFLTSRVVLMIDAAHATTALRVTTICWVEEGAQRGSIVGQRS
jgi:hypothetical protein